MIDIFDEPLADDEIPVLAELPRLPQVAMPEARVRARYLALQREIARDCADEGTVHATPGFRRGVRAHWKIAASAIALGAAGWLALSITVGSHTVPADQGDAVLVASWTPIPAPATVAQRQDAARRCSSASSRIVLAEQRGQVTALLLTSSSGYEACIVGGGQLPSVTVWSAAAHNQDFGTRVLAMRPFPAAFEVGTVASDVAKVTVTLTDGRVATATLDDGWAFVWWPDNATAKTVTEYAADGSILSTHTAG